MRMLAGRAAPRVAVVCGAGNNGGDGWVVARVLRARGIAAIAYLAAPRDQVRGDARLHLDALAASGGVVRELATAAELAAEAAAIGGADLVVDALFGVGLSRPITGHLAAVIATMGQAGACLAVDVPSGLDADTGATLGVAVVATRTVTMAALKVALATAPGVAAAGAVEIAELGIPGAAIAAAARAFEVEHDDVVAALPRRGLLDHKGRRGHVAVIAGSPSMRGAGRLAATAALRVGAGLCTLAADGPGEIVADDALMTRVLAGDADLTALLAGKAAIVIGCGLGRDDAAWTKVVAVLAAGRPAVLDADALTLLAAHPEALAATPGAWILTPHPGEAARLLATTVAEVERDRLAAARALARSSRAVVVLKGARTIVCDGRGGDAEVCLINPTGSPALATAGSGDVLAGAIGGLLAQGLAPRDAAMVGAYVHGLAGERLAAELGPRGVMSSDLPRELARTLGALAS
jgi:NAD(P)H-hydrate epimerase